MNGRGKRRSEKAMEQIRYHAPVVNLIKGEEGEDQREGDDDDDHGANEHFVDALANLTLLVFADERVLITLLAAREDADDTNDTKQAHDAREARARCPLAATQLAEVEGTENSGVINGLGQSRVSLTGDLGDDLP